MAAPPARRISFSSAHQAVQKTGAIAIVPEDHPPGNPAHDHVMQGTGGDNPTKLI